MIPTGQPDIPVASADVGRPVSASDSAAQAGETEGRIQAYLDAHGVTMSARDFVRHVSNLYHQYEAPLYDEAHDEIAEASIHWAACLAHIGPRVPAGASVLDVGAGTGFASLQVLKHLGDRVSSVVCSDLSHSMLQQCAARVVPAVARARFVAGGIDCLGAKERFDLILTNSVLHHLVDLEPFLEAVKRLLRPGGVYIAGHEPSSALYADKRVYGWTRRYRRYRRLKRLLSVGTYARRLHLTKTRPGPIELTNETLVRTGVIDALLDPRVIRQFVDIHVPPESPDTPFFGHRGLSAQWLYDGPLRGFERCFVRTYPHIKEARSRLGPLWRAIDARLAARYPDSGANFITAARRPIVGGPTS